MHSPKQVGAVAGVSGAIDFDPPQIRTVVIGGCEWTTENLALPWPGSWAPAGDEQRVAGFGRLYTFAMACEIVAHLPGWRLPGKADVEALIHAAGGARHGAAALKRRGSTGFEAVWAGFREPEDDCFKRWGKQTGFWTSVAAPDDLAWKFWLREEDDRIRFRPVSREYGDSVRLVRAP